MNIYESDDIVPLYFMKDLILAQPYKIYLSEDCPSIYFKQYDVLVVVHDKGFIVHCHNNLIYSVYDSIEYIFHDDFNNFMTLKTKENKTYFLLFIENMKYVPLVLYEYHGITIINRKNEKI